MRRFLQLATVLACSAVASFAGPSIVLSGNTTFTVNYNAFDDDNGTPFTGGSSAVNYTVSNWTQGTDNNSTVPYSSGTKYTSFKMSMDISNTSTIQSYVTSLGWVTNPDIDGNDSSVAGIWDEFNDNDPDDQFPGTGAEFCLSGDDDSCGGDVPGEGVQNGKKTTVSATMYFVGWGTVNFQNFYVRYEGMNYTVGTGRNTVTYKNGIGIGDVQNGGAVVPEPSSFAALAAGVGAVAYAVRRRKQQA